MRIAALDFDDNIAHTSTKIVTASKKEISTADLARSLRTKADLDPGSFVNFTTAETKRCKIRPAQCLGYFRKCVVEKKPVAVISARSHGSEAMRLLLRRVLNLKSKKDPPVRMVRSRVSVYCVNSPEFDRMMGIAPGDCISTGERKWMALNHFTDMHAAATTLSFSDDDLSTIDALKGIILKQRAATRHPPSCTIKLYHATRNGLVRKRLPK